MSGHRQRRVWKEKQGSRRALTKKAGRKFIHHYKILDENESRLSTLGLRGKQ